jgi:choline dehydrogenase-like flavoprotein
MVPIYEPGMEGPENGFTLMGGMVRPLSRGSIRLTGPEPEDPLALDPNILACASDGVDGLRMADASVMPTVTTGNTNAPSIMIRRTRRSLRPGGHGSRCRRSLGGDDGRRVSRFVRSRREARR